MIEYTEKKFRRKIDAEIYALRMKKFYGYDPQLFTIITREGTKRFVVIKPNDLVRI